MAVLSVRSCAGEGILSPRTSLFGAAQPGKLLVQDAIGLGRGFVGRLAGHDGCCDCRQEGAPGSLVAPIGSPAAGSLAAQLLWGLVEKDVRVVGHGVFRTPHSCRGWGTHASRKWSPRADICDQKAMPDTGTRIAPRHSRDFMTEPVRIEVVCHDMRKKVLPFPPREATDSPPPTPEHSPITVQVGRQRYTLHIPCRSVAALPASGPTPKRLETLQVQTRFLRLLQPAGLGDQIDGWRVCWVGGWDKGSVFFVVMVERVVRAAQK
jgi:hypothetical protein